MASHKLHLGKFQFTSSLKGLVAVLVLIGLGTFFWALKTNPERAWASYLTSFFYFSTLSLGAVFFIAINNLVNAGWSVGVRRLLESFTCFLPMILVGALLLLFGMKTLYPWADPTLVSTDELLIHKSSYLNIPFYVVRVLIFVGLTLLFAKYIVGNSLKQDETGDVLLTKNNAKFSVIYILFFALGFSFFSVDLMMSLLPHWYSTIFGVYTFAGMFQATMAALIWLIIWVRRQGLVEGYITEDHLHDLAKFMKGFTVFWAYIAFSQFMLIWYTDIPEETEFFMMRAQEGWMSISFFLLVFRFVVPFLALLPRWAKRTENYLLWVSGLVLFIHYVDIFWLVYPNFNEGHFNVSFIDVGVFIGFLGIFLGVVSRFLSKYNLVPVKDPRMHESLSHHVTY